MKTIKAKILNNVDFTRELRVYNSIVRSAFCRFQEGKDAKVASAYCNALFHGQNCWFIRSAVEEAKALFLRFGERKIIFGGKANLKDYMKGLKSKEEYKQRRLAPISIVGEKIYKGNRLFDFDLPNCKMVYKPCRGVKKEICFRKFHGRIAEELKQLQELIDNKAATVSIKFNNEYVWIIYEESLLKSCKFENLKDNRVLGIDLNPNALGIAIVEFGRDGFKVLHKQVFDTSALNEKNGKSPVENKPQTNKRKYELIKICHDILNLANVWKCGRIAVEDLNIKASDKGMGKAFNRLCNNVWCKNLVHNKLKMLSNMHSVKFVAVNPCYSSLIGNLYFGNEDSPDMVASATEIARRGFERGRLFLRFDVERLKEQWKQTLAGVETWKQAFHKIKESGLKYRFPLAECLRNAVFSKVYGKKKTSISIFKSNMLVHTFS